MLRIVFRLVVDEFWRFLVLKFGFLRFLERRGAATLCKGVRLYRCVTCASSTSLGHLCTEACASVQSGGASVASCAPKLSFKCFRTSFRVL